MAFQEDMEIGATLVESLSKVRSRGLPFAAPKYALRTHESVVVRDVLQMLQGYSSAWFYWDDAAQKFCVNNGMHVSHLSQSSLNCILYRFMHAATCLQRIEAFAKQVETSSCSGLQTHIVASPTLQAFANSVSARLKCLRKAALEKELESAGTAAGTTVTLLNLGDTLSRVCAGADFLLQVVNGLIPYCQSLSPGQLATHILDYLYEKLNEYCLIQDGEEESYHTLLLLFIGSLRPLTESLDSWLHEGTISDPSSELFFYSNSAIAVEDSAFWEKGYSLRCWISAKADPYVETDLLANDEKRGKDRDLSIESGRDGNSTKLKTENQSQHEQVPVCPIFIQPIAKEIVSAGKSLQLLRHVQTGQFDISEGDSLGMFENSAASAIWLPLSPQSCHGEISTDAALQQHSLILEKMSNVEQSVLDKSDRLLSLFENFSIALQRLLGYGSGFKEDYFFELEPSVFSGQISRPFTVKKDSVVRSEDGHWKSRMQQTKWWHSNLDTTCQNFLKRGSQDLSLLHSMKNMNEAAETPKKCSPSNFFQSVDIDLAERGALFGPENATLSVSEMGLNQQKELWNNEFNLSKCCFLPPLNDQLLRVAIYDEDYSNKMQHSELALDGKNYSYFMDEGSLKRERCTDCGENMFDSRLNTFIGTNYVCGFGFGDMVIHQTNADSKALELLYPYPTLLPRVQENFHVSELLPCQQNSRLASRVLDWLENVKLNSTPLPMVLVQECLISFIKNQVDCVGRQILLKLMDEWRLMDELVVLRAIYLFGSGDLLQQFCAVLFNKLDRGESWDDYYELNTMLQESIRSSADGMLLPSLDSLEVTIAPQSDGSSEQGFGTLSHTYMGRTAGFGIDTLDSLRFSYKVAWPLELIADEAAINKYNQVMAFLFKVKRAKFVLDKTRRWMWKRGSTDMHNDKLHLLLQQKLMHFVNTFHQYVMDRVLYNAWIELCDGMAAAGSLDEVIACHEAYLVSIQRQCFVAPDKLWALIASRVRTILGLALDFYSIQHTLYNGGGSAGIKARCQMEVDRVGQQFDECIIFLLRVLSFKLNVGHFPHLVDLVTRINYNNFYMNEGGHMSTSLPESNYTKGSQLPRTNLFNKSLPM